MQICRYIDVETNQQFASQVDFRDYHDMRQSAMEMLQSFQPHLRSKCTVTELIIKFTLRNNAEF